MKAVSHLLITVVLVLAARSLPARADGSRCSKGKPKPKPPVCKQESPFFGVAISRVPAELQQHLRLKKGLGRVICHVMKDSPAAKAGIKQGDVITQFDGKNLEKDRFLPHLVRARKKGDSVKVTIIRSGRKKFLKVTLDTRVFRCRHCRHCHKRVKQPADKDNDPKQPELKDHALDLSGKSFQSVNTIFRDPRLTDKEKTEKIRAILKKMSLPLTATVKGKSLSIQSIKQAGEETVDHALESLPAATRLQIEKRIEELREEGRHTVRVIQTPKGPVFVTTLIRPKKKKPAPDKDTTAPTPR